MTETQTYECGQCGGQGDVNQRRVGDGEIASDPCPVCGGTGVCLDHDVRDQACSECGKSLCESCGDPARCGHVAAELLCDQCAVLGCPSCVSEARADLCWPAGRHL